MCEWSGFDEKNSDMPFDEFKTLIDSAIESGLKKVVIGSHGEPTRHPEILKILYYLLSTDSLEITVLTNLNCRDRKIIEVLARLDVVFVSIDGVTKVTYEKVRRGGNFDLLMDGLWNLSGKQANITLSFTIQKDNYEEIPGLVDLAKAIGARQIRYQKLNNIDRNVLKKVDLEKHQFETVTQNLQLAARKAARAGLATNCRSLIRDYRETSESRRINRIPCYMMWIGLFVNSRGEVFPCCNAPKEMNLKIGALAESGLKELWTSQKLNQLRKVFLKEKKPHLCEYCCYFHIHRKIHRAVSCLPFSSRLFHPSIESVHISFGDRPH